MKCTLCGGRIRPGVNGWADAVHVTGSGYVIAKSHQAKRDIEAENLALYGCECGRTTCDH
jgi:hypothetical protein